MKFKIKLVVIIFTVLVFFSNLSAQNAFYEAEYLSGINLQDLYKYIIFVENASDFGVDKKELGNGELLEELTFGKNFLKDPWLYAINTKDFRKAFTEVESLYEKYEKQFRNHILKLLEEHDTSIKEKSETEQENAITKKIKEMIEAKSKQKLFRPPGQPQEAAPTTPGKFFSPTFQSILLDAAGTIIAVRLKEEITVTYINKFRKKLETLGVDKAFSPLFPNIFELVMKGDPFDYDSLGGKLKKAVSDDLDNILGNLLVFFDDIDTTIENLKNSSEIKAKEKLIEALTKLKKLKDKDLFTFLLLAVDVSDKLIHGSHLIDLLDYLDFKYKSKIDDKNKTNKNIYKIVHLINIVQNNLRAIDESKEKGSLSNTWIGFSQLNELISVGSGSIEYRGVEYFLALIYYQNKSFFEDKKFFKKGVILRDLQNFFSDLDESKKLDKSKKFIDEKFIPVYQIIVKIDQFSKRKSMTAEDYADYMQSTLDLIKKIFREFDKTSSNSDEFGKVIGIAQKCLDTYKSIYKREYFAVVSNTVDIINLLSNGERQKGKFFDFLSFLVKYAKFMETLANAKDVEDVKGLISSVILPSGSYIHKRRTGGSLTISAHPGFYFGSEKLGDDSVDSAVVGFTAPIGLELCFGSKSRTDKSPSLGFFLSVFDLGAVVSYRIKGGNEEDYKGFPKEITFRQILSPGFSVNFGFKNSPITIGVGVQRTPQLRKIIEKDAVIDEKKSWRIFARFSWDMPLINIFPRFRK